MRAWLVLSAGLLAAGSASVNAEMPARIAIIIDDVGYRHAAAERALALPGPVAYAILPDSPGARRFAGAAHERGKEVLLHLPMQATVDDGRDEPASIRLDMSRDAFARTFDRALASVPNAIGVNNHRGSLVTRHPGHMLWLMEEIRARSSLFFVDSYTTHHSVALQIASESGVQAVKRDVFLDPDRSAETVAREFERLKSIARQQGTAVAIGHPYAATLEHLERELPRLASEGFRLVPISELAAK